MDSDGIRGDEQTFLTKTEEVKKKEVGWTILPSSNPLCCDVTDVRLHRDAAERSSEQPAV